MGDKETLILERKKRGQVSKEEIKSFSESSFEELLKLLNSNEAQNRTVGSILIRWEKYNGIDKRDIRKRYWL